MACVTVDRLDTPRGELVLRRDGDDYEIVSNGVFLMDTRNGESERRLVRAAVAGLSAPVRLLLGGLGVGFSLAEALRSPAVAEVTVVEVEPAVVGWHRAGGPLAPFSGGTASAGGLRDGRVTVVVADLAGWLAAGADRYDAICLDVDNGPEWTVTEQNAELYTEAGLAAVDRRLAPGGTLAVWSAAAAPAFERRLRARYAEVAVQTVPVPRGEPDVIYLARGGPTGHPLLDRRAGRGAPPSAADRAPSRSTGTRSAAGGPDRTP